MNRGQKKAVAIAAVMNYIHQEETGRQNQTVAISLPLYQQLMNLYQQLQQLFAGH